MRDILHCEWEDVWNIDSFGASAPTEEVKGTSLFEVACRWGNRVGAICDVVHRETDEAVVVC